MQVHLEYVALLQGRCLLLLGLQSCEEDFLAECLPTPRYLFEEVLAVTKFDLSPEDYPELIGIRLLLVKHIALLVEPDATDFQQRADVHEAMPLEEEVELW